MVAQYELWKRLAERLGIVAIAPCELEFGRQMITFAALLPQFGGSAGLVADPRWEVIEPNVDAPTKAGFGYSEVELEETIDDEAACYMLRDWTWSGSGLAPSWL